MPLSIGTKLGPYEIVAPIGAGGMGEVYRAKDTKLKRDVALKVLPEAFARDPERMARFQREAEVLASLNHPNIAAIYGVEDRALVMEMVEGESPKGPLPFEEAWHIASQIASALEYAHDKGIVHRDLKPANIKITPEGVVKLLDFGLAKAFTTRAEGRSSGSNSAENSPTLTIGATEVGMILGTAAYMAPEQARGKAVDKRADIWSFGVVLYELLTGERLFSGEEVADTLAHVLTKEPDLGKVPAEARTLLSRCLVKDPKKRLRDIGDAEALQSRGTDGEVPGTAPTPSRLGRVTGIAAAVLVVVAIALGVGWYRTTRPAPIALVSRFTVEAPPGATFTSTYAAAAISPDGRYVVFGAAAEKSTGTSLWLRPLDSLSARQLPGTDDANFPVWSPDSKSIAFSAEGKLKRFDLAGGAPLVLCDLPPQGGPTAGEAWNHDGIILMGGTDGLWRIPASGGTPAPVTKADTAHQEAGHGYPQFLPDGTHFLYFVQSGDPNTEGTYAASLDQPRNRTLVLRSPLKSIYTPPVNGSTGYLLSLRGGTLLAQPFDAGKLHFSGDPTRVAEDVPVNTIQRAAYWTSDAGVLMHRSGQSGNKYKLVWMSRDGKRLEQAADANSFGSFEVSPDGKKVAAGIIQDQGAENIWVVDLVRSVTTRLSFGSAFDRHPVWSPDGSQIAFTSNRTGIAQIFRKDAAGAGQEEQLTTGPNAKEITDWSPDGKNLIYTERGPKTDLDIWALPVAAGKDGGKPVAVLQTSHTESEGQLSPDGKWLAYASVESSRWEVYIRAFPGESSGAGGKWQVSNQGGRLPRWRGDGKELFYATQNRIMAAAISENATSVQTGAPRELMSLMSAQGTLAAFMYDVTADGQRFLVQEAAAGSQAASAPLTVIVNWQAGLRK